MNTGEEIAGTAFKEVARRFSKMVNRMTLDEAIKHAEEVVREQEEDASKWEYTLGVYRQRDYCDSSTIPTCEKELKRCKKCAEEHQQLAEWLKELKEFRLLFDTVESARWLYESWERYGEKR